MLQSCSQLVSFWLQHSHIKGSVIGCNSFVANGCEIEESMLMGNDNYSNDKDRARARAQGLSVIGIGKRDLIVLGFNSWQFDCGCDWKPVCSKRYTLTPPCLLRLDLDLYREHIRTSLKACYICR